MTAPESRQQSYSAPKSGLFSLARGVWSRQADADAGLLAAGIAFYGLLSLFPAITAGAALAGIALPPRVVTENSEALALILPASWNAPRKSAGASARIAKAGAAACRTQRPAAAGHFRHCRASSLRPGENPVQLHLWTFRIFLSLPRITSCWLRRAA
ncbi:hypothetical protein KUW17_13840 [Leisingera aquaemixtae]|uniref:hypothetical protein n=1 Tax=Leisingera aquaemixtae TaxID=1396826 RepID=UPI001C975925|nr:hypothetical protein [Leisingera aquaemixtae]MBY6067833.1 hypothetical protein [Leisingera aquaemixtae]